MTAPIILPPISAEDQAFGTSLPEILRKYDTEVKHFWNDGTMDDDLYQALYAHYLDSGEMPYGVAKARTGDPNVWIANQLEADLGGRGR